MVPRKYRVFLWLAPLIALNLLGMTTIDGPTPFSYVFLIAPLFAQASLAATWLVLGPMRSAYRVPIALIWLLTLFIAVSIRAAKDDVSEVLINIHVLVHWTMAVLTLGVVRIIGGYRLRHSDEPHLSRAARQFGIGPLLVVTAIVGLLTAYVRIAIPSLNALRLGPKASFVPFYLWGLLETLHRCFSSP